VHSGERPGHLCGWAGRGDRHRGLPAHPGRPGAGPGCHSRVGAGDRPAGYRPGTAKSTTPPNANTGVHTPAATCACSVSITTAPKTKASSDCANSSTGDWNGPPHSGTPTPPTPKRSSRSRHRLVGGTAGLDGSRAHCPDGGRYQVRGGRPSSAAGPRESHHLMITVQCALVGHVDHEPGRVGQQHDAEPGAVIGREEG